MKIISFLSIGSDLARAGAIVRYGAELTGHGKRTLIIDCHPRSTIDLVVDHAFAIERPLDVAEAPSTAPEVRGATCSLGLLWGSSTVLVDNGRLPVWRHREAAGLGDALLADRTCSCPSVRESLTRRLGQLDYLLLDVPVAGARPRCAAVRPDALVVVLRSGARHELIQALATWSKDWVESGEAAGPSLPVAVFVLTVDDVDNAWRTDLLVDIQGAIGVRVCAWDVIMSADQRPDRLFDLAHPLDPPAATAGHEETVIQHLRASVDRLQALWSDLVDVDSTRRAPASHTVYEKICSDDSIEPTRHDVEAVMLRLIHDSRHQVVNGVRADFLGEKLDPACQILEKAGIVLRRDDHWFLARPDDWTHGSPLEARLAQASSLLEWSRRVQTTAHDKGEELARQTMELGGLSWPKWALTSAEGHYIQRVLDRYYSPLAARNRRTLGINGVLVLIAAPALLYAWSRGLNLTVTLAAILAVLVVSLLHARSVWLAGPACSRRQGYGGVAIRRRIEEVLTNLGISPIQSMGASGTEVAHHVEFAVRELITEQSPRDWRLVCRYGMVGMSRIPKVVVQDLGHGVFEIRGPRYAVREVERSLSEAGATPVPAQG